MIVMMCNGCNRRIAEDDPGAARRIQLAPGELVDWCGECVAIVRAELSRVVAESRAAQRAEVQRATLAAGGTGASAPVHQRAMRIWEPDRQHIISIP
jgi:hypothetical protein